MILSIRRSSRPAVADRGTLRRALACITWLVVAASGCAAAAIEPGFDDRGVADALVRRALDDVRAEGVARVVAVCPFVTWWVEQHPTYASVVYDPTG